MNDSVRTRYILSYLDQNPIRKLHLGAGSVSLEGWLNTDIDPGVNSIALNVTQPFPFNDETFHFIFNEHLIEHLSFNDGMIMLRECRRILRPGGVLRIATPDLSVLTGLFNRDLDEGQKNYIKFVGDNFINEKHNYLACHVINTAFRNWGHKFIYDEDALKTSLLEVGFSKVVRCAIGISDEFHLNDIDKHGLAIGNESLNRFETMVFEASL